MIEIWPTKHFLSYLSLFNNFFPSKILMIET
jgi:hypothetical protein